MAQMVFKRYEVKYQLTDEQRARLERVMAKHMIPDEYGPSTVRNIYYDTPDHLLARRSAEHPYYKEKLRIRSYVSAGNETSVFLELKKKCDGIVYKRRCTLPLAEAHALLMGQREPRTQIEREIAFSAHRYAGLEPAMFVAYDREAYYAANDHEFRMTFDRAVRCRWDDVRLAGDTAGELLMSSNQNLLEVKCAQGMPIWLVDFFSAEGIRKGSFSKYGTAFTHQLASAPSTPALREARPVTGARHLHKPEVTHPVRRLASLRPATLA